MERLRILSNLASASSGILDSHELSRKINRTHRNSVLKWLFESLDLLRVEDSVFFATVLLADRYCCRVDLNRKLEGADLQLVILASLCCSLKVVDTSVDLSVKAFLEHVSGGHVDPKDIFQTEARLLKALEFDAFIPSLSDFVTSFYEALCDDCSCTKSPLEQELAKIQLPYEVMKQQEMAKFLLYLTVLDVERLHSMTLPRLVAGCILSGAWIVNTSMNYTRSPEAAFQVSTIADCLVDAGWLCESDDCLSIIHETTAFWEDMVGKPTDAVDSLKRLFGSKEKLEVSKLKLLTTRVLSGGG